MQRINTDLKNAACFQQGCSNGPLSPHGMGNNDARHATVRKGLAKVFLL